MRNRYLPETDIANWAFLPPSLKERRLEAWLKPRQAKGSYDPYRATQGDAVNLQLPLYPTGQVATPWSTLEDIVRQRCRGDETLLKMNLPVARATHEFASEFSVTAEPVEVRPITLSNGQRYGFGAAMLLRYDYGASVMFSDLRRTGHLTPHGRRVVHSILHIRFRENYPEYEQLRLEVWRHRNTDSRSVEIYRHSTDPLYSYDQISADFAETYEIMNRLRGELVSANRASGGDFGPLFGTGV